LNEIDVSLTTYIGTDESGKGDFFGPLVIAAVLVNDSNRDELLSLDVKDSKKVTDKKARRIANSFSDKVPVSVVVIGPQKYNELYGKIRNLNRLLAWGHARVVENILEKNDAAHAVTDQFGDPKYVGNALMKLGREIDLVQETKAEKYIGVAAASIVARARFLEYLDRMASQHQITFPKGAGPQVDQAAAEFCRKHGEDKLDLVAKMHFKNSRKVRDILSRDH